MPSHSLDGKKIDPKHATPKSKSKANKTKKIFVGGVSQETSAEEVKAYFSQFGKVEEAVMLMDQQTKRHRGFGFVTFENEDVVDRVCEIHFHTIKNKKVECKKAQPKEAVQAANTAALLGKRVILSNLGIPTLQSQALPGMTPTAVSGLPGLIQQTPSMAALAAAQSQAAALGYGKLLQAAGAVPNPAQPSQAATAANVVTSSSGGGPQPAGLPSALSSFRYAPYPMPSAVSALSASQAVQQAAALAAQQQTAVLAQQQQSPQQPQQQQQQHQHQHQHQSSTASAVAQQAAAAAAVAQHQQQAANNPNPSVNGNSATPLNALTSMPTVSLALASNQALQTFAQSGAHAAVIPSVTASGGLAAPGLTQAAAGGQLAQLTAAAGTPNAAAAAAAAAAVNPYSGYSLTNVDMSSFQGVDWSSVYGMGMYV